MNKILKSIGIILLVLFLFHFSRGMKEGFETAYERDKLTPPQQAQKDIDDKDVYIDIHNDYLIDPSWKGIRKGIESQPMVMTPPFLTRL